MFSSSNVLWSPKPMPKKGQVINKTQKAQKQVRDKEAEDL